MFFYAKSLPVFYYAGVIATFSFAALCKKRMLSLAATIMFGLLILYYPLWLFVQIWFPDIYFYLYESMVLVRDAHFGVAGHAAETPGVSLISSSYLMITNADAIAYAKIYQVVFIIVVALLLYGIAAKMDLSNPSLAPLFFFAIVWQDELHFCRLSFSLIFYFAFLLLLLRKRDDIDKGIDLKNILMSSVIAFAMVLSHPATPLFLLLNILVAVLLVKIFIPKSGSYLKDMLLKAGTVAVIWFSWNMASETQGTIATLEAFVNNVVESLSGGPQLQASTIKLSSLSYTSAYYNVVMSHLIHWILIFSLIALAFFAYGFRHKIMTLTLSGFLISSQSTALLFYFGGLAFFSRPSLFTYIAFAPLAAFAVDAFLSKPRAILKRTHFKIDFRAIIAVLLLIVVVFSAMAMPVFKYADTPFLYLPTKEHYALNFSLKNLPENRSLVSTSYNTPSGYYSELLQSYGGLKSNLTYNDWIYLVGSNYLEEAAVLVLPSFTNRDAFFKFNQTYQDLEYILLNDLPNNHSKIYDAGEKGGLYIPTR